MGFGTLFIGYLIGLNTIAYPGFTKILSYLVMLLGVTKLARFNRHLKSAYYVLIPTALIGLCYLFVEAGALFSLFSESTKGDLICTVSLASALFEFVFLWRLMKGLQELSVETEVKILEIASFRNRLFTAAYYLLYIPALFEYPEKMARFMNYYSFAVILIGLAVMLLNAKLFYNFYMWICLPEDLTMERKPSRFALVEKIQRYFDSVEERQLERRREKSIEEGKAKAKRKENHKKK